jgi:hypothetical protein
LLIYAVTSVLNSAILALSQGALVVQRYSSN